MSALVGWFHDKWAAKPPATAAEISEVERAMAVKFPPDYVELLTWSNGGEATVGSAYISLWPVQEIPRRNLSASITKYMSAQFVGIGTNGGAELYALDYTAGEDPTFAIVPLGDLDPDSKYIIADTLTQGFQRALDGDFDDGEYNAQPGGRLNDELLQLRMVNLRVAAEKFWQKKDYKNFVALLDGVTNDLTEVERKKLHFARSRTRE